MKASSTRIVARYNETDKMGVVHHSQYVNWFEVARTDWIKKAGIPYHQIEEQGLMLPVIGIEVHYHSPARFDDAVIVETSLQTYDSIKMGFKYRIFRENGHRLLADGSSTHCWTDRNIRPVSLRKKNPELDHFIKEAAGLT